MKEYVRLEDGYRIRVTEKAYNLFYRKQGFVPVNMKPDAAAVPEQSGETAPEPEADEVPKKKRTKKAPAGEQ